MAGGNNDTAHLYWQASFSRLTRIEGNSGGPLSLVRIINSESEY